MSDHQQYDIGIIGAGISGLMAGAHLAKLGHKVTVFDRARWPGGTAGHYMYKGVEYPTGATLMFGMEQGGALRTMLESVGIQLDTVTSSHPMDVVLPDRTIHVYTDMQLWRDELRRKFSEQADRVLDFWDHVHRTASAVYRTSKAFIQLPVQRVSDLGRFPRELLRHPWTYMRLLPEVRWTVDDALRFHGLTNYHPLERFLNAQLVDAAQIDTAQAAWLPSCLALDIYRYGIHYVQGGFPAIARALVHQVERCAGSVSLTHTVEKAMYNPNTRRWSLRTNRGDVFDYDFVVNASGFKISGQPSDPEAIEPEEGAWGAIRIDAKIEDSWLQGNVGAVAAKAQPFAFQIAMDKELGGWIGDEYGALYVTIHPNDVVSISTHTTLAPWRQFSSDEYAKRKALIIEAIWTRVDKVLPGLSAHITDVRMGTPRTYSRYLNKDAVGGMPLTVATSISHPRGARSNHPQWFLAGDSVFPGPGSLSAAMSGVFAARAIDPRVIIPSKA